MNKRIVFGIVAVFVAWQALDFVLHGLILASTYQATAELWRPMAEMKLALMRVAGLVAAVCFVCLYAWLVRPKSWAAGLAYGLIFGAGTGFLMGFGTYAVMPLPQTLAVAWCLGSIVQAAVAGLLVGWLVQDPGLARPSAAAAPA
jgi:hypothetical protein